MSDGTSGVIVVEGDEAYAELVAKIAGWNLPNQQPNDLPTLEQLNGHDAPTTKAS